MKARKGWVEYLSNIAYAVAISLLMRLIVFLLEVPSDFFTFRQGGKVLAGWILLFFMSTLSVNAVISVCRWWRTLKSPESPSLQGLQEVFGLEKERGDAASRGGEKSV